MSDIKKFIDIINESTVAGSVAGGAPANLFTKSRMEDAPAKDAPKVIEYGNWENSSIRTTGKVKASREKATRTVKSVYGESAEKKSDEKFTVYCSQCGNEFKRDKKEGYSSCKTHALKKSTKKPAKKVIESRSEITTEGELNEHDLIINPSSFVRKDREFIPRTADRTDHEIEMAKNDLFQAAKNASHIFQMIKDTPETSGLEGWVQEKIVKAADYLRDVREYIEGSDAWSFKKSLPEQFKLQGEPSGRDYPRSEWEANRSMRKVDIDHTDHPSLPGMYNYGIQSMQGTWASLERGHPGVYETHAEAMRALMKAQQDSPKRYDDYKVVKLPRPISPETLKEAMQRRAKKKQISESKKLKESKMVRGMLVQSPEEFVKSSGYQPAKEDMVSEAEQPIVFQPKIKTQYSADVKAGEEDPTRSAYSKPISPEEVANIAHQKNSYVIYYVVKAPDDPSKSIQKRVTTEPIYIKKEAIDKKAEQIAAEVDAQFPDLPEKAKKTKAYTKLSDALEKMAVEEAIKSSQEVKDAIKSGKVVTKQLKAMPFITTATKVSKPSVHRSAVPIVDDSGEIIYNLDELAANITQRPKTLLKVNEKMVKSGGKDISMANIGIPAITGLVVDEKTNQFRVVNTCPGAGVCKQYCYATKGGYIQYRASFESQARVLNYWYNDPEGFKNQIISELKKLIKPGVKVYFRWHDSGDFFDNAYLNLAFDVARALPEITIYAYTKLASVANDPEKPANFVINFSGGAKTKETAQIDFKNTKFSEVVPSELFKDEKTTGVGLKRLQARDPEAQARMKKILAKEYDLDPKTILTYDEMLNTPEKKKVPYYNVIIVPSLDGDIAAARKDVLGSYLLYH